MELSTPILASKPIKACKAEEEEEKKNNYLMAFGQEVKPQSLLGLS